MPMCHQAAPPLYRTAPHAAAACFLYREKETVQGVDMGSVLVEGDGSAASTGSKVAAAAELRPGV